MSMRIHIDGWQDLARWFDEMGLRASRATILPIMKSAAEPIVALERAGINSLSGALSMSLKARSGPGDFPGRTSVYISASATPKQLVKVWGRSKKMQHRQFAVAASFSTARQYRVFYAPWVEAGHRIVHRDSSGNLVDRGHRAKAVEFAARAADAGSDQAQETIIADILNAIAGD